jgi:septal ring factor EnvC (AmiA/AmiB activator)
MNSVIAMHTQKLERERQLLGGQIKIAYITGRNDYLKLLLNQEDPARVGRMLAYYDYFNRARAANIRSVLDKVETIRQFQQNIQTETDLLMELKSRRIANSEELATWRESRQTILARLQNDISAKDQQLKSLKEHEKKLSTLLRQLDDNKNLISTYQDSSPFGSLSGKLQWPVAGRLLNAFGDERRGPSLTWDGIRIAAAAGHEVHAVYNGKVVFSGWFRNLGLLLIIDHGDGYMSLYGHNQSLQKKSGDMVATGEVIAYVGDSGGQDVPAVYFEIRQNGKPRDPSFWCSR